MQRSLLLLLLGLLLPASGYQDNAGSLLSRSPRFWSTGGQQGGTAAELYTHQTRTKEQGASRTSSEVARDHRRGGGHASSMGAGSMPFPSSTASAQLAPWSGHRGWDPGGANEHRSRQGLEAGGPGQTASQPWVLGDTHHEQAEDWGQPGNSSMGSVQGLGPDRRMGLERFPAHVRRELSHYAVSG